MITNKTILITGVCGFLGHHVVEYFLEHTNYDIIGIDKLSYASFGLRRLQDIYVLNNPRFTLHIYDLMTEFDIGFVNELKHVDIILHLAAETHVDNSISDPIKCITNNVISTLNLLELARKIKPSQFIYFSTDEVYGNAEKNQIFTENDRHNPMNPYSASKSSSEMICKSYYNTYKVPLIICNTMNIFGERQHYEKFIPKCISKILKGEEIQIHSYPFKEGENPESGSRFYIYAKDVAASLNFVIDKGIIGETYNILSNKEVKNDFLCKQIASILNKEVKIKYIDYDPNRPGNDLRYCLCDKKLKDMGWENEDNFYGYLKHTVQWTLNNQNWLSDDVYKK